MFFSWFESFAVESDRVLVAARPRIVWTRISWLAKTLVISDLRLVQLTTRGGTNNQLTDTRNPLNDAIPYRSKFDRTVTNFQPKFSPPIGLCVPDKTSEGLLLECCVSFLVQRHSHAMTKAHNHIFWKKVWDFDYLMVYSIHMSRRSSRKVSKQLAQTSFHEQRSVRSLQQIHGQ